MTRSSSWILVAFTLILAVSSPEAEAQSNDPLTYVGFQHDNEMNGPTGMAVSADGGTIYVAARDSAAIAVFARDGASHELTWVGTFQESDPFWLGWVTKVAVSPDGGSLYATGFEGVSVYDRDPATGLLTFLEGHEDGVSAPHLSQGWDTVVSLDDKQVYIAAENAITVFTRNRTTGLLTFLEEEVDGQNGVDGLAMVTCLALSPDGAHLYGTGREDDALAVFGRDPYTGSLTFLDVYKDSYAGLDGLDGAHRVAVSPDGAHVYVVADNDSSVATFARSSVTGLLTFAQVLKDGVGGVDGLASASGVAVSGDGESVYVTAAIDRTVAVFQRAPATGLLSPVELLRAVPGDPDQSHPARVAVTPDLESVVVTTRGASGLVGSLRVYDRGGGGRLTYLETEWSAPGLSGPVGVATSRSGCVMVAGGLDSRVAALRRLDPTRTPVPVTVVGAFGPTESARAVAITADGAHAYVASHDLDAVVAFQSSEPEVCPRYDLGVYADSDPGVDGLIGIQHLSLSPDERHLYTAAELDDAVAVFSRDPSTGELTFVQVLYDGSGGVDGLDGAYWVALSPDGAHVYVASYVDDAVAVFSRNPTTGALTYRSTVWDGVGGVDGLNGASSVGVSPDGAHVYVAGRNDDSLAVFSRAASSGALTYRGRMVDGVGGLDGLDGARALAVSPDGDQVYLASQVDHALAVFSRNPSTGTLTQVGLHRDGVGGVDGLDTADGLAVSPDGVQVFVSGFGDDSLAAFTRTSLVVFVDGFESGTTGGWSGAVP